MYKPLSQLNRSTLDPKEWEEEVQTRIRPLARLERIWTRPGALGSTTQVNLVGQGNGVASGSEEKERRLFAEALRDGYVLCQCVVTHYAAERASLTLMTRPLSRCKPDRLVNKLFPATIARVDKREDGFVRTSNVTKFLAGSSSVGVSAEELFHRDDLIEATSECLSRVAKTILALSRLAEFPGVDRSKIIQGQQQDGGRTVAASPYGQNNRAAASTPNLSMCQLQRSTSPASPSSPVVRKRWSPHQHLPTVRSDSPNEDSSDGRTVNNDDVFGSSPNELKPDPRGREDVRPSVPPRSPLRVRPVAERVSVADSTRASVGDSIIGSLADSVEFPVPIAIRQSQASSNLTDTTMFSSLLEPPRTPGSHNKFGTIRTVTTDVTSLAPSESPSITRTEGSSMASSFKDESRKRSIDSPSRPSRERRPSETAIVDLSRVVEEMEDSATSRTRSDKTESDKAAYPPGAPLSL